MDKSYRSYRSVESDGGKGNYREGWERCGVVGIESLRDVFGRNLRSRLLSHEYHVSGRVMQRDIRDEESSSSESVQGVQERRSEKQQWVRLGTKDHLAFYLEPLSKKDTQLEREEAPASQRSPWLSAGTRVGPPPRVTSGPISAHRHRTVRSYLGREFAKCRGPL